MQSMEIILEALQKDLTRLRDVFADTRQIRNKSVNNYKPSCSIVNWKEDREDGDTWFLHCRSLVFALEMRIRALSCIDITGIWMTEDKNENSGNSLDAAIDPLVYCKIASHNFRVSQSFIYISTSLPPASGQWAPGKSKPKTKTKYCQYSPCRATSPSGACCVNVRSSSSRSTWESNTFQDSKPANERKLLN